MYMIQYLADLVNQNLQQKRGCKNFKKIVILSRHRSVALRRIPPKGLSEES